MTNEVLKTQNLSKKYNSSFAVKDCSITIKQGQIYGLVGKNGAGKTTLMRLICGQSKQTSGNLYLFGNNSKKSLVESRTRIGCMIETPSFYPDLSAKKNLMIYSMKKGIPIDNRIDEILEFVGLSYVKEKPFSKFSLGMKERLGIALALLGNPEFLVLDEPTNGLDPVGIAEIRNLILRLNEEKNITVLLSSHILKEMSMVATYYGFIDKGKIIKELSREELMEKCREALLIEVNNPQSACVILEQFCNCKNYQIINERLIKCYDNVEHPEQINQELVENGLSVYSISSMGKNLEDYFIELLEEGEGNA